MRETNWVGGGGSLEPETMRTKAISMEVKVNCAEDVLVGIYQVLSKK